MQIPVGEKLYDIGMPPQQALVDDGVEGEIFKPDPHAPHEINRYIIRVAASAQRHAIRRGFVGHLGVADLPLELLQIQYSQASPRQMVEDQIVAALVVVVRPRAFGDLQLPLGGGLGIDVLTGEYGHQIGGDIVDHVIGILGLHADVHLPSAGDGGGVVGVGGQNGLDPIGQLRFLLLQPQILDGDEYGSEQEFGQGQVGDAILIFVKTIDQTAVQLRDDGGEQVVLSVLLAPRVLPGHVVHEEQGRFPHNGVETCTEKLLIPRVGVVPPQALHRPRGLEDLPAPMGEGVGIDGHGHRVGRVREAGSVHTVKVLCPRL